MEGAAAASGGRFERRARSIVFPSANKAAIKLHEVPAARGWRDQLAEPAVQAAVQRFVEHAAAAVGNLERLTATAEN